MNLHGAVVIDGGQTPVMGDSDRDAARELSLRGVTPPVKVPGYEQEQFLGHGAYGEVWTAVNRNSGRRVAIKYFTRRGGLDWSALAREVEKLRYLFSDRYVVQLFEVGWESDPPYYVMEFMENGSLEDLLQTHRISVHEAVNLFREIAVALVHAHDKGILHCDLKPANVLLDHDRKPRLADFGQSRLTNEMSPALGTLFYMAPEQADLSATPDARWDVYALGAVMYRMLVGEPPHRSDIGAATITSGTLDEQLTAYRKLIVSASTPKAHRKVPGVDSGLTSIIDKCLEPSPAKRFPNPQAVLTALDAWSLRRTRRPILWLTGLIFALLFFVMAAIGAYVFWTSVNTAEREVIDRTLEANSFAARAEAQQMALETEHRWRVLEFEAADPRLRDWLAAGPALENQPDAVRALDAWLAERREKYNHDFRKGAQASLWLAVDRGGFNRGMAPPFPRFRHKYFGFRDYFTGLGRNEDESVQPPPAIISGPHRSIVYRRKSTRTWATTFSVPVSSPDTGKPVGVLAMSVDLDQVEQGEGSKRFSVLVDTRPDGNGKRGLIVRHPYMSKLTDDTDDEDLPLYYADELVKLADTRPENWQRLEDYRDPVAREPFSQHAWLAFAEPVVVRAGRERPVDTGFVIVVQEQRDEVLHPVNELEWRLSYGAMIAAGFLVVLIALMWAGVVLVMDTSARSPVTRLLRRWAGLPTSTTGTVGTIAASSSFPSSVTAIGGGTPTPRGKSEDREQRGNQ